MRAHAQTSGAHLASVSLVLHEQRRWEGLQILRAGQFGHQALWVNVESLLSGPGAQVQVQAPLKLFMNEPVVHGHLTKAGKGLRNVGWLVFIVHELPGVALLLQSTCFVIATQASRVEALLRRVCLVCAHIATLLHIHFEEFHGHLAHDL